MTLGNLKQKQRQQEYFAKHVSESFESFKEFKYLLARLDLPLNVTLREAAYPPQNFLKEACNGENVCYYIFEASKTKNTLDGIKQMATIQIKCAMQINENETPPRTISLLQGDKLRDFHRFEVYHKDFTESYPALKFTI